MRYRAIFTALVTVSITAIMAYGCGSTTCTPGATGCAVIDGGTDGGTGDAGNDSGTQVADNSETCKSGVAAAFGPGSKQRDDFYVEVYPFPNGYYLAADSKSPTGFRVAYPDEAVPFGMNEQFGFGTFGFLMEKFYTTVQKYKDMSVTIDESTMPATSEASVLPSSSIFLVSVADLLEKDPSKFSEFAIPLEIKTNAKSGTFFARNRKILKENSEYVFVVTKGIKVSVSDSTGAQVAKDLCIAAPDNFRAARSPSAIKEGTANYELEPLRQKYAPIFERLEKAYSIPRNTVATLSVYRTTLNRQEVTALREKVAKTENLDPKILKVVRPLDAGGKWTKAFQEYIPCVEDNVHFDIYDFTGLEAMVHGKFNSSQYCCVNDRFNRDVETGEFKPLKNEELEFLLFVPKSRPELGIKPPFKMVVFHHAFQVCKETLIGIAGELARFGYASAAIDMVGHGSRATGTLTPAECDLGVKYCNTKVGNWIKFGDIAATVSYMEQSLLDDLAFVKMLKGFNISVIPATFDADGIIDLKASGDGKDNLDMSSPYGFISQSLGSFLGVSLVGLEHQYDRAVFNVGLGAFYKFIVEGISPGADINSLDDSLAGYILGVQTICDRVEAMNYSDLLVKAPEGGREPVNVLFQGAKNDEVVPPGGTDIISWEMGLEQCDALRVVPGMPQVSTPRTGSYLSPKTTIGYFQAEPAEHVHFLTSKYAGATQRAQFQAVSFIRTAEDGKAVELGGTIINPYSCSQSKAFVEGLEAKGLKVGPNNWCTKE